MNLREMIVERILWAVSEQELVHKFQTNEGELYNLSDVDLLEMYEDVMLLNED